ncbi:MAG: helicase-related protein [Thermoplasmata archaeon]
MSRPGGSPRGEVRSPSGQRRLEEFGEGGDGPAPPPARPARPHPDGFPEVWRVQDGTIAHPLLRPGALRAWPFQIDLARIGLAEDLVVVLPTGLGKTVIAALIAAEVLRRGDGRVLFLAPTRPLVQQHSDSFGRWIDGFRHARFTGSVRRPVREGAWETSDLIFATPEIVVNDLTAGRYDLTGVDLVIFDEAHHAVGKYAYVPIAERFRAERRPGAHLLGLTASPGGKDERIEEVLSVFGFPRVEARTREDPGVREYVQPVGVDLEWVDLPPEIATMRDSLEGAAHEIARRLQRMGYLRTKPIRSLTVKDLVALRGEIFARPGPMTRKFTPLRFQLLLLHLFHALERLETQGVAPFLAYLDRVAGKEKPSRGDAAFLALPAVAAARAAAGRYVAEARTLSHPKLGALLRIVEETIADAPADRPPRILVFAQYRDTIQGIQSLLESRGHAVGRFVGQATRDPEDQGMSQAEQGRMLAAFRSGTFPILVASSVAEEGLDVPDVDLVVFYESVPSEIRAIQRRGRTGRSSLGRVVVLLTRSTREVQYQAAEVRREHAMRRIVRRMSAAARRAPGTPPDPPPRGRTHARGKAGGAETGG